MNLIEISNLRLQSQFSLIDDQIEYVQDLLSENKLSKQEIKQRIEDYFLT